MIFDLKCAYCHHGMSANKVGQVIFCESCGWGNKVRYNKLTSEFGTRIVNKEEAEKAEWDEG